MIICGGRRLAIRAAAPVENGAAVAGFLAARRVDDAFADDVTAAREIVTGELSAAWRDD